MHNISFKSADEVTFAFCLVKSIAALLRYVIITVVLSTYLLGVLDSFVTTVGIVGPDLQ